MISTAQIRVVSLFLSYYVEVGNCELLLKEGRRPGKEQQGWEKDQPQDGLSLGSQELQKPGLFAFCSFLGNI